MEKIYQILIVNELDVIIHLGFYKELDDAIDDINDELKYYDIEPLKKGDLVEHPSTLTNCFDKMIYDRDEMNCIHIGGFIFDKNLLIKNLMEK